MPKRNKKNIAIIIFHYLIVKVLRNGMKRFDLNIDTGEPINKMTSKNFGERIKAYCEKSVKEIYPLVYGRSF